MRSQISHLVRLAERWLAEGDGPPLLDRLVMDRCIRSLHPVAKCWASGNQPGSVNDLVKLLENHQVTQWLCGGTAPPPGGGETRTEQRGRTTETQCFQAPPFCAPGYPTQTTMGRMGLAPPTPREEWRCYTCGQKGHLARHCKRSYHLLVSRENRIPNMPVWVGRQDTHALLNSGNLVTLVQPGLPDGTPGRSIEVGCIHGQTESYLTERITVQTYHCPSRSRLGWYRTFPCHF